MMVSNILNRVLFAALAVSSTLVSASPSLHKRYAVKDYHPSPRGWKNAGECPGDHMVDLSVGLTQNNFKELERQLYEVSDPRNPRYGQHLSPEEVQELVKPSSSTYDAVHEWLEEHGIDASKLKYSPAKDWIKISLPVDKIEKLLDTKYSVWEHEDGSMLARTESWSLPLNIHKHISTIQPTNSWARLNPKERLLELGKRESLAIKLPDGFSAEDVALPANSTIAAVCNFTAVTPACLRTLYGVESYTVQSNGGSRMGLTNYLEEYNNRSDTHLFLSKYRPEAAQAAYEFPQISVNDGVVDNGTNTAEAGTALEGNLDSEYMLGVAWPINLTAYSTGGRDPSFMPSLSTPTNSDEPFLAWVNYILGQDPSEIPQVISTSYGDDEQTISKAYAEAVCNQFAQLGAQGVSLLFASGDYGVGDNGTCFSNADNTTAQFLPSFPNGCPYVTNVGGTKDYPEQAVYRLSSRGNIFASGAGFSNYFDQPSYQSAAVDSYVAGLDGLHSGLYNPKGRAYPDISCVGQIFPTIWNGTTTSLLGTSGSSPICSSILALVNDALLANGKPVLGFLNPWLYGGGYEAFTDVTNGSSYGCGTSGFPAKVGWDAVTGFGTPYFPNILENLGVASASSGGHGGRWGDWTSV